MIISHKTRSSRIALPAALNVLVERKVVGKAVIMVD